MFPLGCFAQEAGGVPYAVSPFSPSGYLTSGSGVKLSGPLLDRGSAAVSAASCVHLRNCAKSGTAGTLMSSTPTRPQPQGAFARHWGVRGECVCIEGVPDARVYDCPLPRLGAKPAGKTGEHGCRVCRAALPLLALTLRRVPCPLLFMFSPKVLTLFLPLAT